MYIQTQLHKDDAVVHLKSTLQSTILNNIYHDFHDSIHRVTWGKAPPFGDDLSLTYSFASTSEEPLHVCNKLYGM